MFKNKGLFLSLIVLVVLISSVILARWSPWLNESYIETIAVQKFELINADVQDGCGFNCENCGFKGMESVPFGRKIWIEYNCGGPYDSENPPPNITITGMVSFLGKVNFNGFE